MVAICLLSNLSLLQANQEIWQKIDNLEKQGKIEEAKKLKAEAITEITKLYISQFPKIELADRSIERINTFEPKIQEMLYKCFDI